MQPPVLIPPGKRRTQKCARCGLRYPADESQCPHCSELSDQEVQALRTRVEEEQQAQASLGRLFGFIAVILAVLVLIVALWR